MFILALFMSVGLFANASNGETKKSISKTFKIITSNTLQYVIVYHCWSGDITVSGFSTYAQASSYLQNHGVNTICP